MSQSAAHAAAELAARRSYGKLIAFLSSRTGDITGAEDALSEAFASALSVWPVHGCPATPEAWLLSVARRKAVDAARRRQRDSPLLPSAVAPAASSAPGEAIPDQRLALMFVCAHPAIDAASRAPLMLQTVLGLNAQVIAAAFLTSPAAMGKRLVRAKEKIRQAGIAFRIPERAEWPARVAAVLDAIYAAFSEGWTDASGAGTEGRELTNEALFLARLVVELLPEEPEALGLLAFMLHAEARRPARRTPPNEYVPFDAQDTALWNWPQIAEAEFLLRQACSMAAPGPFQIEAALQSAHVHRRATGQANWNEVLQLYDALLALTASPVVAINRALAMTEVHGAQAALAVLDALEDQVRGYQPYWAARAGVLACAGRPEAAREAYRQAIALAPDPAVRRFLEQRLAALGGRE